MERGIVGRRLFLVALLLTTSPLAGEAAGPAADSALAQRIERLVETLLTADDAAAEGSAFADARTIFEREGIPSVAKVGDDAAYGFVMMNMLGQAPPFRTRFLASVRSAAARHELPADAVIFAEARHRQTAAEERYAARKPSQPELRDEIERLFVDDQAVRKKEGFDLEKMADADRRTAGPLKAMFHRYGVPTYERVGVQAAKDFVAMVQHQPPEFRAAVLPKLKANVDAGQAEPGGYAIVYDRTRRDQGRNQFYGGQLECSSGQTLELAPLDDPSNVNRRRAELGLMRVEIYAKLVRLHSPDMCGAVRSPEAARPAVGKQARFFDS